MYNITVALTLPALQAYFDDCDTIIHCLLQINIFYFLYSINECHFHADKYS